MQAARQALERIPQQHAIHVTTLSYTTADGHPIVYSNEGVLTQLWAPAGS